MVISLPTLESHLWETADILRGPSDAADFKTYIFPLLFFNRIRDVWDEEYQEIVGETGDEQLSIFLSRIAFRSRRTVTGMTFAPKPRMLVKPFITRCALGRIWDFRMHLQQQKLNQP